jgi:hypothetical protein
MTGSAAAWLLSSLVLAGCGNQVSVAPVGAHPSNGAVAVPFPPPPARVEEIPAKPRPECVWVDGYWEFSDRWEWQPGEWVLPQAGCRLAPVELRRTQGRLFHARPRWYPDNVSLLGPQSACPRPPACGSGTAGIPAAAAAVP